MSLTWRPIDAMILNDEKVRKLSAPPPNARDLWLWVLMRPAHYIPGLMEGSIGALADELSWKPRGTKAALEEVERAGMLIFDPTARVLYLPNALRRRGKYGPAPQSPSVLASWAKAFALVPESPLKARWVEDLRLLCEALGAPYLRAWHKHFEAACPTACPTASPTACPTASPRRRDQAIDQAGRLDQEGREKISSTALRLPTAAAQGRPDAEASPTPCAEEQRQRVDYRRAMDRERSSAARAEVAKARGAGELVSTAALVDSVLDGRPD